MPSSTIAVLLLLSSLSWGCRPLLRQSPWNLASPEGSSSEDGASEEKSDEESAASENDVEGEGSDAEKSAGAKQTSAPPVALGQGEWILRVAPPGEEIQPNALRWRNVPLEELLAQPKAEQPDFTRWLKHKSNAVAANAAIAAARNLADAKRDQSPSDHTAEPARDVSDATGNDLHREGHIAAALSKTARASELKLPHRRAAIEALGRLSADASQPALLALVDQYGDFAGPNRNVYSADLHLELLSALAQQPSEASLVTFLAAITCRAAEVRLAAMQYWPASKDAPLPEALLGLAQDPDPRVRSECLKLLARCQHERAFPLVQRALNDLKFDVRLAAVQAMGSIPGDDAREELARVSRHPAEGLRAAAVKALAERAAWEPALQAADDEAWQVRLALAGELSRVSTSAAARAAEKLLDDTSVAVQQKTVESIGKWPWPRSGKLLLEALDSTIFQTRETSAKVLSEHWEPGANFPYQADPETRFEALLQLQEKWQAEYPNDQLADMEESSEDVAGNLSIAEHPITAAVKQQVAADLQLLRAEESDDAAKAAACARLASLETDLPVALVALIAEQKTSIPDEVYAQVLPAIDPQFELLAKLATAEVTGRRQAVRDLRASMAKTPLSELALLRLVDLVVAENDPLVWHEAQQMLEGDMRETVVRLQYAALNHPAAEVQRRACLYLGNHGDARHAVLLSSALADENPQVVRAAAAALGQLERIDNTLPLVRLLASRDRELMLIVASSLARQGEECGGDGLERVTLDVDPKLRRRAIEMMAELKQARFIPALVRALDDQLGIKQTALDALAATVGQDIGRGSDETAPPMAEQIHRWKQWYAKQEKAQARRGR